jgi:hypothetical protein
MNALGWREAKWNIAVAWPGRVQAGNGSCNDFRGFTRPLAGRHQFWESLFDGHFGIQ